MITRMMTKHTKGLASFLLLLFYCEGFLVYIVTFVPHTHTKKELLYMPTHEIEIGIVEFIIVKDIHLEDWNWGYFLVVSVVGKKISDGGHPDLYQTNVKKN